MPFSDALRFARPEALRPGAGGFGFELGAPKPGGRDHIHRARHLLDILDAADAATDFPGAGHGLTNGGRVRFHPLADRKHRFELLGGGLQYGWGMALNAISKP